MKRIPVVLLLLAFAAPAHSQRERTLAKILDAPAEGDVRKAVDFCDGKVHGHVSARGVLVWSAVDPRWEACEFIARDLSLKKREREERERAAAEGPSIEFIDKLVSTLGLPRNNMLLPRAAEGSPDDCGGRLCDPKK